MPSYIRSHLSSFFNYRFIPSFPEISFFLYLSAYLQDDISAKEGNEPMTEKGM
jgi:hypothetical protein